MATQATTTATTTKKAPAKKAATKKATPAPKKAPAKGALPQAKPTSTGLVQHAPKLQTFVLYAPCNKAPYAKVRAIGGNAAFSAYTIAFGVVTGALVRKGSLLTSGNRKAVDLWLSHLNIRGHWGPTSPNGYTDQNGITSKGLNNLNGRLAGKGAYKTTPAYVAAFETGIRKGGTVKVEDKEYFFTASMEVSI